MEKREENRTIFVLIVIDRFHVMKLVNKALNKIRLLLDLKGLKNRDLLLKNGEDLTEAEKQDLKELLNNSPCLSIAYELNDLIIIEISK